MFWEDSCFEKLRVGVPLDDGAGAKKFFFFRGWDLFRPKNPFKVPRGAVVSCSLFSVVGTYLGPEILLRYHEGLYDSHSFVLL